MMEQEQVKRLLEKFYNGETTLQEEKSLIDYFLGGEVPEMFMADRDYFLAMAGAQKEKPSSAFSASLEKLVDTHTSGTRVRRLALRPALAWSFSVAASLLILAGVYLMWIRQTPQDTFTNPQLAYQETRRVLLYVSQQLNKGTGELAHLGEIGTPEKEINRIEKVMYPVYNLRYLDNLSAGTTTIEQLKTLSRTQEIMNKYLKINNTNQ